MENIIGLKELRQDVDKFAKLITKGQTFIVMRKNKPLFRLSAADSQSNWEMVADFTKIKKGGVDIDDILALL